MATFKGENGTAFECREDDVAITSVGFTFYVKKADLIAYVAQIEEEDLNDESD